MIELVGVVVGGRERARLERCDLEIRPGEILGVLGGSGAGKSTLLGVLAGQVPIDRGRILMDGRDITKTPGRLRERTGLVGHELDGPNDIDPRAWLAMWAELDGVKRSEQAKRIEAASTRFGIDLTVAAVGRLSRGQSRRLALARVWCRRPDVLLLDQPGDALDGEGLRVLTGSLQTVVGGGTTVVMADASPHLPASICDRVIGLKDGVIAHEISRGEDQFGEAVVAIQGWAD